MYQSLQKYSSEPFQLLVLALDIETFDYLSGLNSSNLKVTLLEHFENLVGLKRVKETRSWKEYCWTLASQWTLNCLMRLPSITYLDADLMFFSDPIQIFNEIGFKSIAITPHRFAQKDKKRLEPNGIFNVGWVTFQKDAWSLLCASQWAKQCREWCYERNENGRFGDQKYLDEWPVKYEEACHIIQHPGANLAPWNIANYSLGASPGRVLISTDPHKWDNVIFYHYHEFGYNHGNIKLTGWPLREEDRVLIYEPYVEAYQEVSLSVVDTL